MEALVRVKVRVGYFVKACGHNRGFEIVAMKLVSR